MVGNLTRLACGWALVLVACSALRAQEAVLTEFYGRGVHNYFGGRCNRAIEDLDVAIDGGSRDPRAFYFRGLAKMRAGGSADLDLQMAAQLEMADTNQYYPVGKSLERIQGPTRQVIERYRALARAQALSSQRSRDAIRYEDRRKAEDEVLRKPVPHLPVVPPSNKPVPAVPVVPAPPATPKPPAAAESDAIDDLFAPEEEKATPPVAAPPAAEPPPAPEMPEEPAEELPSGEEPPAAEVPAAEPSDAAPAAETPAEEEKDPFADETDKK